MHVMVTGGAGFIGSNVADHYLREGHPVRVFDNVSRPGVERNLRWLRERHGSLLRSHRLHLTHNSERSLGIRN